MALHLKAAVQISNPLKTSSLNLTKLFINTFLNYLKSLDVGGFEWRNRMIIYKYIIIYLQRWGHSPKPGTLDSRTTPQMRHVGTDPTGQFMKPQYWEPWGMVETVETKVTPPKNDLKMDERHGQLDGT